MFSRRMEPPQSTKSFSKSSRGLGRSNSSFSNQAGVSKRRHDQHRSRRPSTATTAAEGSDTSMMEPISPIVTLLVGPQRRLFAAHEHILLSSPFFRTVLQSPALTASPVIGGDNNNYADDAPAAAGAVATTSKKIALPDEEPVIFSCVLEYLYKGDYFPRLVHNKKRNTWELEHVDDAAYRAVAAAASVNVGVGATSNSPAAAGTIYHSGVDGELLRDTVVYCAADKYGLEELKKIALRKQGLQTGIQATTILASARFAYANTPDSDSRLRAHYLALIIRSRSTFKRSGTMQLEMFNGGTQLFFDLFVALCNHVDDISSAATTPRSGRFF